MARPKRDRESENVKANDVLAEWYSRPKGEAGIVVFVKDGEGVKLELRARMGDSEETVDEIESLSVMRRRAIQQAPEDAECDGTCPDGRYCREHGDLMPED